MPLGTPGVPGRGGRGDTRTPKQRAVDQAKYQQEKARATAAPAAPGKGSAVQGFFDLEDQLKGMHGKARQVAFNRIMKMKGAQKELVAVQKAGTKEIVDSNKATSNWQKSLLAVGAVYAKIRSVLGQVTGAAKQTVMFTERLAAQQHIVLGAVRQTTDAWLQVSRIMAHVFSIIEIIPAKVIAIAIVTAGFLALSKAVALAWAAVAASMTIATGGFILLAAAAATLLVMLTGARAQSDAIKGTWTDITNLWKNAQSLAFTQPLGATGQTFGDIWGSLRKDRIPTTGYGAAGSRDTRQAPTGETDF